MIQCPKCGKWLPQPGPTICPVCGAALPESSAVEGLPLDASPVTPVPPQPAAPRTDPHECRSCHQPMTAEGELGFRVGGATGGTGWLLGNWNQLSEQVQSFAVYHCPSCGRIELFESGR